MRGTYELILSVRKGYGDPYFIEYSDKMGMEFNITKIDIGKYQFDNTHFNVTPDYVVWWESSTMREITKDLFEKTISSCGNSFDCGFPYLF